MSGVRCVEAVVVVVGCCMSMHVYVEDHKNHDEHKYDVATPTSKHRNNDCRGSKSSSSEARQKMTLFSLSRNDNAHAHKVKIGHKSKYDQHPPSE